MPLEMLPAALDTQRATRAVARSLFLRPTCTGCSVAAPTCHRLLALAIAPLAHVALTYRSNQQTPCQPACPKTAQAVTKTISQLPHHETSRDARRHSVDVLGSCMLAHGSLSQRGLARPRLAVLQQRRRLPAHALTGGHSS